MRSSAKGESSGQGRKGSEGAAAAEEEEGGLLEGRRWLMVARMVESWRMRWSGTGEGRGSGLDGGGEVVEGEDVGGDHGEEEEKVQPHRQSHGFS
ncbi:hypothetical protein SASPL_121537 [Salvia splendens]|uniref:Uncharacterized protein n=1 Tax=Salvia splendens TaxID=180675 RepID=A0A8X8XSM1_SALSN|nr:hypothetical protein SASPL_121537 [Salvia splendens]